MATFYKLHLKQYLDSSPTKRTNNHRARRVPERTAKGATQDSSLIPAQTLQSDASNGGSKTLKIPTAASE